MLSNLNRFSFFYCSVATCARCGGILITALLQIYRRIFQWKNVENRLRFDRIVATSLWSHLFGAPCMLTRSRQEASGDAHATTTRSSSIMQRSPGLPAAPASATSITRVTDYRQRAAQAPRDDASWRLSAEKMRDHWSESSYSPGESVVPLLIMWYRRYDAKRILKLKPTVS